MKHFAFTVAILTLIGCGESVAVEQQDSQITKSLNNSSLHADAFATIIGGDLVGDSLNIANVASWGNGQWRITFEQPVSEYAGLFATANGNRALIANAILWDKYRADVNVWRLDCDGHSCFPMPVDSPQFTLMVISLGDLL